MRQLHVRELIPPTTRVVTGVALLLSLADPASAQPAWTPTILGPPGIQSGATDVNDAGQVVGYSVAGGTPRAVRWRTAGGDMEHLAPLGDPESLATAINNAGDIVGNAWKLEHLYLYDIYASYGFRWTEAGGMTNVSKNATTIPPNIYGADEGAADINDAGQIALSVRRCFIEFEICVTWAVVWTPGDSYVAIDNYLGGRHTMPASINEVGELVGSATTAGGQTHAFRWTAAGRMADLGTLGGSASQALGINNAGQVVGSSTTASGQTHAFLWTAAGGMLDLGTFGGPSSQASAINGAGQVVGWATAAGSTAEHAFVWTSSGGMQRLADPTSPDGCITSSAWASGINATGQIVGTARCATGDQHAILWGPSRNRPSPSRE